MQLSAVACYSVKRISGHGVVFSLTMSTVTSPTFVAPCALRKFLTRSCSFGILSAKMPFKSVLSELMLRTHVMTAGQYFCEKIFLKRYLINRREKIVFCLREEEKRRLALNFGDVPLQKLPIQKSNFFMNRHLFTCTMIDKLISSSAAYHRAIKRRTKSKKKQGWKVLRNTNILQLNAVAA